MNRLIKIKNQDIEYQIKKSNRAKRLRIAVYHDASVIVTVPKNAKVKIKRKPKNPYLVEVVDDRDGQVSKKQVWYTPDYEKKQ